MTVETTLGRRAVVLAWGAVVGVVIFDLAWIVADAVQRGGYSAVRDDVSDLGALTVTHAWIEPAASGVAGVLVIAFALFALRPALFVPGRGTALGAWLVAASLMGLDDLSDLFFRLDCRAADPGCSASAAVGSWHGVAHVVASVVATIATVAAPFALAPRMRLLDGWRDLARPTVWFGWLLLALLAAYAVLERRTGGGTLQRAAIVLLSVGIVALALRVRSLAGSALAARAASTS